MKILYLQRNEKLFIETIVSEIERERKSSGKYCTVALTYIAEELAVSAMPLED